MHVPAHNTPIKPDRREALLIAIAKARQWMDDLAQGRAASFAAIARREGKVERHIRKLAPLASSRPGSCLQSSTGNAPSDSPSQSSLVGCRTPGPRRSSEQDEVG